MDKIVGVSLTCALSAFAVAANATILNADADGDGVNDTIETGTSAGAPYVKVQRANTGIVNYYTFGVGLSYFELVGTTDTNGVAGQEIVVRTGSSTGPTITVIEDRVVARRQYDFGVGLASFGIVSMSSNTDGRAGNEVVVYLQGSTPQVRIIDDARRWTRSYDFGTGLTYFEITRLTDTNGQGGVEIVTRLDTNSSNRYIRIVDDTAQFYRQYPISGSNYALLDIRNYDGQAGDELCYRVSGFYYLLVDRTGSSAGRANCN